jgi:hypothetical protein
MNYEALKNLDKAVNVLLNVLTSNDLKAIEKNQTDYRFISLLGKDIRNNFKLWELDNPLVLWFKKTYGIDHADDISEIIINCLFAKVKKQKYDPSKDVLRIKDYWKNIKEISQIN